MNLFWCLVTVGPNAILIVQNRRQIECKETVRQRSEGKMECDSLNWSQARSNPPPGCLWQLWRSASTPTEPFHPDRNIFCWWTAVAMGSKSSKYVVPFQLQVGTKPEPFQRVLSYETPKPPSISQYFDRFHILANSELLLQLTVWVLIISHSDIYINHVLLEALLTPIFQCVIRSIIVEFPQKNKHFVP
jgi:hypothetical protein